MSNSPCRDKSAKFGLSNNLCITTSFSFLEGIVDDSGFNKSGVGIFVTLNGSMTKDRFPAFCKHFVDNLPHGQGKGGEPVLLIFDGHASRWNYKGLLYLLQNNVFCLCLPGHTSIWSQPNDGGCNASFKTVLGRGISKWRTEHRPLPGFESVQKRTRGDFVKLG